MVLRFMESKNYSFWREISDVSLEDTDDILDDLKILLTHWGHRKNDNLPQYCASSL